MRNGKICHSSTSLLSCLHKIPSHLRWTRGVVTEQYLATEEAFTLDHWYCCPVNHLDSDVSTGTAHTLTSLPLILQPHRLVTFSIRIFKRDFHEAELPVSKTTLSAFSGLPWNHRMHRSLVVCSMFSFFKDASPYGFKNKLEHTRTMPRGNSASAARVCSC